MLRNKRFERSAPRGESSRRGFLAEAAVYMRASILRGACTRVD